MTLSIYDANGRPKQGVGIAAPIALDPVHFVGGSGEPTFQNSWVNYDNSAATPGTGSQRSLIFRKDPTGRVRLGGVIKNGANGTVVFTLPVGYRPRYTLTMGSVCASGMASVGVDPAGNLSVANSTGVGTPNVTGFVFLDGIEFDTESVLNMPSGPAGPKGDPYYLAPASLDPWHYVGAAGEPAFQNGWVNYASGWTATSFRKFPDGKVSIRGMLNKGGGNWIANEVVFTLPVGYRPPGNLMFTGRADPGAVPNLMYCLPDGRVQITTGGSSQPVAYLSINFDFDTELVSQWTVPVAVPVAPDPHFEQRYHAANQAVPTGAWTKLQWDSLRKKVGDTSFIGWDAANNRFNVYRAGVYHLQTSWEFSAIPDTAQAYLAFSLNGTYGAGGTLMPGGSLQPVSQPAGQYPNLDASLDWYFNAGDTVEVVAYHGGASSWNHSTGSIWHSNFSIRRCSG